MLDRWLDDDIDDVHEEAINGPEHIPLSTCWCCPQLTFAIMPAELLDLFDHGEEGQLCRIWKHNSIH